MLTVRHLGLAVAAALFPAASYAAVLQSPHFRLDPNVAGAFGGTSASGSYKLQDIGGETVVGAGSSASYKLVQGYVAQLQQSIQLTVLPSGVTAYYPLDSVDGASAYDVSQNQNNGLLKGTPAWTGGKIDNALAFDDAADYVTTTSPVSGPSAYTIELWVKTGTANGGRIIGLGNAQTGASTSYDRHVYMSNDGRLHFGAGANQVASSTAAYNNNAWHHVAATMGAGGMSLYVDGIKVGINSNTTSQNYTGYWRLAQDNLTGWPSAPTGTYFNGTVDEVKIYNRMINQSEVANAFSAGSVGLRQAFTIPNVTPGQSQTYLADAIVRTDAGGYDLSLVQDHPLRHTDGSTTIGPVSGNITAPAPWVEGTTKGLGFTLTAGTGIDGKWGSDPAYSYAAVPSTLTNFHSRTGLTGGSPEKTTMQYRVDVQASQKQGIYSNNVVYTATMKP